MAMTAVVMVMRLMAPIALVLIQRQVYIASRDKLEDMFVTGFQMIILWLVQPMRISHCHHGLDQQYYRQQGCQAIAKSARL